MSRLPRRGILGGAAALVPAVGVGSSPAPVQPDVDLIALYAQHARNHVAVNKLDGPAWEDEGHPLWLAYHGTHGAVKRSRPRTLDGVVAKARVAAVEEFVPGGNDDPSDWAGSVVRDLLRVASG